MTGASMDSRVQNKAKRKIVQIGQRKDSNSQAIAMSQISQTSHGARSSERGSESGIFIAG